MKRKVATIDYGQFILIENSGHDHVSSAVARGERWEPSILAYVEKFVTKDMAVMDIGANLGTFAVRLGQLVGPNGIVYAFEPQRVIFQQLCGNVFLNALTNVYAYNYAVGETEEWTRLSPINYDEFPKPGEVMIGGDGELVQMVSIDSLNIDRLDLVKIDVERYEPYVFKGMENTIAKCRPIILFELTTIPLTGFDRLWAVRFLQDMNYTVTCIAEESSDYLAIPNEHSGV